MDKTENNSKFDFSVRAMELSESHRKYLANKHKGGTSNQKGNTYETIFATKVIVDLFASDFDVVSTFMCSQLKNSFVDDLSVVLPDGFVTYYQLKNKKNLSWGNFKPMELLYDFYYQRDYLLKMDAKFKLVVVYSDKGCPLAKNKIPSQFADVTEKEYFPSYERLEMLLQESPQLQYELNQIMNYPGEFIPLDVQAGCLDLIRGQWMELSNVETLVSLDEIRDAYDRKHPGCPNFRSTANVQLSKDSINVLESFKDFNYVIKGNVLYWMYRHMEGNTLVHDLELALERTKPETVIELITLLN